MLLSVLTLLASRSAFTRDGTAEVERFLVRIKIPQHFHQEASFGLSTLLLLGLLGFHVSLPEIAVLYNNRGDRLFYDSNPPQLASALTHYQRALALNPDYLEPRYSLGQIYEHLQKYELARNEYGLAAQGGYPPAYNNLARLYILEEEYAAAVQLLLLGLENNESPNGEINNQDEKRRYSLLKNLGWARLNQGRYSEARTHLLEAIELDSDRASAHCLLSQVYEAEKKEAAALSEWELCFALATYFNIDEDEWIDLARQKLESEN